MSYCSGYLKEVITPLGAAWRDDVATVVQYASGRLHHPKVVLCGQIMGSASILRAIHEHGIRPDAVVIEADFDLYTGHESHLSPQSDDWKWTVRDLT